MQMSNRNYQLDFIKLISAILIFLCHTQWWASSNASIITPQWLNGIGNITVRIFFIISGLLMANSIANANVDGNWGHSAILFVLKKFKKIMWPVWISIVITLLIDLWFNHVGMSEAVMQGFKAIPELCMISTAGFGDTHNTPLWFLSAMFICMLPYSYLLYAKRDFTLYVFSPLTAILTSGYIFQTSNGEIDIAGFNGIFMNELIRTMCGISLGVCAYTIYIHIMLCHQSYRKPNLFFTMLEVLIYVGFIYVVAFARENYAVMSVFFLFPIAVAISFSGASYLQYIFNQNWMWWFAPLSTQIYINHWAAVQIYRWTFSGHSWGTSVFWIALYTVAACGVNLVIVRLGKLLWNNGLKRTLRPES